LIYALTNVGWLIGPLLAGWLAELTNINLVFLLAAIFALLAAVMLWVMKLHLHYPKNDLLPDLKVGVSM
jgi:MFS family permease